jgi:hypothetical protein
VEAVRTACADVVRLLRNMSEALAAASNATRLCAEAAEGIERDLIAISALLETDEDHPHAMTRTRRIPKNRRARLRAGGENSGRSGWAPAGDTNDTKPPAHDIATKPHVPRVAPVGRSGTPAKFLVRPGKIISPRGAMKAAFPTTADRYP